MADEVRLWNTRPKSLDKYIEDYLSLDEDFRTKLENAIKIIGTFLKDRCFQLSSSGKDAALRSHYVAYLVVFLSNLQSYQDQIGCQSEFINEIKKQLEACQCEHEETFKIKFKKNKRPKVLSFTLRFPGISLSKDFNVLPAFDVLGKKPQIWSLSPPSPVQETLIPTSAFLQSKDSTLGPQAQGLEFLFLSWGMGEASGKRSVDLVSEKRASDSSSYTSCALWSGTTSLCLSVV
uniref:Uncharacterized protein n=1 Tax=Monodelphis domestica TaxID=13616 RepID=A0A5F8GVX7_MONDO